MVRFETAKTNKSADQHGKRKRPRNKRKQFIKRNCGDGQDAKAAIDDEIGQASAGLWSGRAKKVPPALKPLDR